MDLKLWSPFTDMDKEWRFEFPRFFGEGFEYRPSLDVVKNDGELTVTAELPGMDPKNVEVALDGNTLTIKGEKTEESEISEENRYMHERSYGRFMRRIPLPEGVKANKMTAAYDNGVLTVHVPLPEERASEPRSIPVKVG